MDFILKIPNKSVKFIFCIRKNKNIIFCFPVFFTATQNLALVFMVGDGILNVTLHSPVPLNDNEWHFVQAELNVKVARIKVDYQPWAVKRFPGQTFVTMQFTHPLLVGKLFGKLFQFNNRG